MKYKLVILTLFAFLELVQGQNKGINWTTGLSWNEVKQKAIKENKYIFLDCYTTWCGPCKKMDELVYVDEGIGKLMNGNFVSVKVQMDATIRDAPEVKSWYADARTISRDYVVSAFPTYLFFNPSGQIVHRELGYADVSKFRQYVINATKLNSQFYRIKADFEDGKRNPEYYKLLFIKAEQTRNYNLRSQVQEVWLNYLSGSGKKHVFEKDNLQFLMYVIPSTKSEWFLFVKKNSEKIGKIMGEAGYARRLMDSAIAREYINPLITPLYNRVIYAKEKDIEDPDWVKIHDGIKKEFGEVVARKNVIVRQCWWYRFRRNMPKYRELFREASLISVFDTTAWETAYEANSFALHVLLDMNPKERTSEVFQTAISMMQYAVRRADHLIDRFNRDSKGDTAFTYDQKSVFLDNYASLLYYAGSKSEAIEWQQKAVDHAKVYDKGFYENAKKTLELMKSNAIRLEPQRKLL